MPDDPSEARDEDEVQSPSDETERLRLSSAVALPIDEFTERMERLRLMVHERTVRRDYLKNVLIRELAEFAEQHRADFGLFNEKWQARGLSDMYPLLCEIRTENS